MDSLWILFVIMLVLWVTIFVFLKWLVKKMPRPIPFPSRTSKSVPTKPQPQFTTELEALIAIEANTRQALELLRQQNRKSFWSMLFLGSIASSD